jgi:general bacterial porin, GBP family
MNKSFLAAVCAVVCSAASAQSSVTAFVLIDLNLSQYSSGSKANAGTLRAMNDGTVNGLNGSRLGFRGSEDLGTGNLAQGGRGWGRQAYLSLSSSAGELRLGRQYVLSDSVVGQGNPFGNALVNNPTTSVTNMGRNLPLFLNAPRADNVVQYQSPSFGGFALAAQIAPGEGNNDRFHGLRAVYTSGAFYVGSSYEWNVSRVSAAYNFGSFKLLGGIQQNSDLATGSGNGAASGVSNLVLTGPTNLTIKDTSGWTVGAEVPFGLTTLGVNYVRMSYDGTSGASSDLGKLALSARHALSKSTFLYGGVYSATGALKDHISQKRVLQAGVRTSF